MQKCSQCKVGVVWKGRHNFKATTQLRSANNEIGFEVQTLVVHIQTVWTDSRVSEVAKQAK